MIKINTPTNVPKKLVDHGAILIAENNGLYFANTVAYNSGKSTFKFQSPRNIYGLEVVKKILRTAQHGKCCYCESKFLNTSYGAVEHFRPKGGVTQKKEKKKKTDYPGYYWLAYEWSNLLFICTRCNTDKSTYFPLENYNLRAKNHTQPITPELALIIHPALVDPSIHISFHDAIAVGITKVGEITIDYVGLNRSDLFESRLEKWKILKRMVNAAKKFCRWSYTFSDKN